MTEEQPLKKTLCPQCKKAEKHVMRKSTMAQRLTDLERLLATPPNFAELPDGVKLWKQQEQIFGARYETRSILCGVRGWCWECRLRSVAEVEMLTLKEAPIRSELMAPPARRALAAADMRVLDQATELVEFADNDKREAK